MAIVSRKEHESLDGGNAHEKSKITRIFECGLRELLSLTYNAALVHSVHQTTLFISLERIIIC